jgi:hypothetical protein
MKYPAKESSTYLTFLNKYKILTSILNMIGSFRDLLINEAKNCDKTTDKRYTKEIKQLGLTLNFYSPKAYNFCR